MVMFKSLTSFVVLVAICWYVFGSHGYRKGWIDAASRDPQVITKIVAWGVDKGVVHRLWHTENVESLSACLTMNRYFTVGGVRGVVTVQCIPTDPKAS